MLCLGSFSLLCDVIFPAPVLTPGLPPVRERVSESLSSPMMAVPGEGRRGGLLLSHQLSPHPHALPPSSWAPLAEEE